MNQVQKIAHEIIEKKLYKFSPAKEGHLSKYSIGVDYNRTLLFLSDIRNPSLDQFQTLIEKDIRSSISKLKDTESFSVVNYHIERIDDYDRKYTTEEQEKIKQYGHEIIPAIHKVIIFTNKVTNEETLKITKLRGAKN